ncbi:glycosyltransferase [Candidatus Gottesmanbacteria bacterium]|nr:glycosyltransferase [Candidatus Gottesmanbacteria bacterium]
MKLLVSVIVPTKNEEKLIRKCLSSLVSQETNSQYEIIAVDSSSTDKTIDIIKQFPVRLIKTDKKGKSLARQIGANMAFGDILIFTEADCVVPNGWLERIISTYDNNPKIIGIGGTYRFDSTIWWLRNFSFPIIIGSEYIFRIIFGHHSFRATNFSILKKVLREVNGFDVTKRELDDVDLSRRTHRLGRILFDPNLCVTTSDRRFKNRTGKFLKEFMVNFFNLIILNRKTTSLVYEDIRT